MSRFDFIFFEIAHVFLNFHLNIYAEFRNR